MVFLLLHARIFIFIFFVKFVLNPIFDRETFRRLGIGCTVFVLGLISEFHFMFPKVGKL